MNNFEFCVSTDVLFGKGQEEQLPAKLASFGKKILLTYGGGSIKNYSVILRFLSWAALTRIPAWKVSMKERISAKEKGSI